MKVVCALMIGLLVSFIYLQNGMLWADESQVYNERSAELIVYDFTQKDADYEETPLRRFEIVFFISLPVSLLITFLGIEGYRIASGTIGPFTQIEYQYLILSTLGISFTVALRDNEVVFLKERF
jgi:hypothetical protein